MKPFVVSPAEKRAAIERFSCAQQHSTDAQPNWDSLPTAASAPEKVQRISFWAELAKRLAAHCAGHGRELPPDAGVLQRTVVEAAAPPGDTPANEETPHGMLDWAETRQRLFLTGPSCTMANPADVASLLSADWHHDQWALIPEAELYASAVDFPHPDADGSPTITKVLMHKRRVSADELAGNAPADACPCCKDAFWAKRPVLCKISFANFLWLGRHLPMFRDASLGRQLLLALGRLVFTKFRLSSKSVSTWRRGDTTFCSKVSAVPPSFMGAGTLTVLC